MSISRLDGNSVHHIVSSQVVIDLKGAIKELVDNALDAGSPSIGSNFCVYLILF